ncbi:MAG: Gfo/Idh/MocA family oxidoreductase [Caldilineaceae bacterium]
MAMKVAVIGLGNIGNTHAPIYQANEKTDLVAVCDIIKERADKAAARYGVKAYYSIEDLFANEEIEAISVCRCRRREWRRPLRADHAMSGRGQTCAW